MGVADGFNSRMGVGPIETLRQYGNEIGLQEMMHATAINFDKGFELNGFGWVTNCWELSLEYNPARLKDWKIDGPKMVIDFTRYDFKAKQPTTMTRQWSLLGDINQKQTRPQDKPVPFTGLPEKSRIIVNKKYPGLFKDL